MEIRITEDVCKDIDEFLFQRLGDRIYNLDAELRHHGATLRLITRSVSKEMIQIKTYEMEIRLVDEEIHSI